MLIKIPIQKPYKEGVRVMQNYHSFSKLFLGLTILVGLSSLQGAVTDITGDTGSAQTGSLIISGGTSGLIFDSTTPTITASANFISMPLTSDTNGQVIIDGKPVLHAFNQDNHNIFAGALAGNFTHTGTSTTACGYAALQSLTSGYENTAIGDSTLTTLTTGTGNIALGSNAASSYTGAESNNIIIGTVGVEGENDTIRIGDNTQANCFMSGFYFGECDPNYATNLMGDLEGRIGTFASARELKENIHPIGNGSTAIYRLQPMEFNYKSDPTKVRLFGLVADEVAKDFPDLAIKDKNGKPVNVRYYELAVLILNELQKLENRILHLERHK